MIVLDATSMSIAERADPLRDRPLLPADPRRPVDRAAMQPSMQRAPAYTRIAWHFDTTGRTPA